MKKIKLFYCYLIIITVGFVLFAGSVSAKPLVDSTENGNVNNLCDCNVEISKLAGNCKKYCTGNYQLNDMVLLLVNGVQLILGIVGSLALIMFVYGGVTFIISAGSQEKVTKGKTIMINAILGVVIVFTSYMIIQFALTALGYTNISTWSILN